MPDRPTPTVTGLLAELHAYRVETMDPVALAANVDQRRLLEETADRDAFVKAGDVVEPFTLPEVLGGDVDLDQLLAVGPVVLLFFRFAGCPACNISLRHYQQELYPALAELGVTLVAVSPQVPGKLAAIKNRYGLRFPVASDVGGELGRRFGIMFAPTAEAQSRAVANGTDLGAELGAGSWELPMPTVVVIDADRVVRFADVHPDWLVRTEADVIIGAVRSLVQVPA
ncbi:MAG TPA: peroxiredoxin-like family protein [Trebonia sp.]|jgi:peroxiredoxin|nr:peroxiredoxin-like family protein [Trebonia sp.]